MNNENHDAISGNAVKMREALEKIASMGEQIDYQLGSSEETVYALRHERCLAHNISECARAALEADEETPEPCPFCGKEVVVGFSENIHKDKYRQVWCSDGERCGYECVMKKTEEEAIAAHNRVCRAVETAAKQSVTDCNHLGNAAKMREALKQIHDRVNSLNEDCGVDPIDVRDLASAALIAPPRNCDVGTAEEQAKRFSAFCGEYRAQSDIKGMCSSLCPCIRCCDMCHCLTKWLQMPYEEGGAK